MYRIITTALIMLCSYSLYAQQTISGIVKDNNNRPVASATVSLLRGADSSWVQSELTGDKGEFSFNGIAGGDYLLDVAAMGFRKKMLPVIAEMGIEISLEQKANTLDEVVVKSKVPTIQSAPGKTIVNFDQADVAGNTVIDLLRKIPGVVVDGSGNISYNGKGVLVMIDDKQTYLSGEDLTNYLRSLSADQVAQLDLMNQPPARYDAEGNSGIINIKTKRSRKAGWNGSVNLAYGQGRYSSTHNSANASYKKDRLSLYSIAGYLHGAGFLDQDAERKSRDISTGTITSETKQHSYYYEVFEDYNLAVGGDYNVNSKLKAGASVKGIYHPNKETDKTHTEVDDIKSSNFTYNDAINDRGFWRKKLNSNVNLRYEPAKSHIITADGDHLLFRQQERQLLTGKNYDSLGQELPGALNLRSTVPINMDVYIAKADYSGNVTKDIKLEAGVKASFMRNENDNRYETLQNGVWQNDTVNTNHYTYHENINAAYVSAEKNLGNKWQVQLGCRMENTNIEGKQEVGDKQFMRSFTSAFPTTFVSYKPNDKHGLELSCGRRINRPSYRNLNPFVSYLSQYESNSGNPELLPAFRNAIALRYNYKSILFSEFSYSKINNTYNPVVLYNAISQSVRHTMQNNANKHNLHFSATCNKQIVPWWTLSASYDWYYNDFVDFNGNSLAFSNGHSFSCHNQFSFGDWDIDTLYAFNSGDLQSLSERNGPNHWINASIARKLWKDAAVIKLAFEDPFDLYRYRPVQSWNGVESTAVNRYATQQAYLSFVYNFGKKADNNQRHNSNTEEAKRM